MFGINPVNFNTTYAQGAKAGVTSASQSSSGLPSMASATPQGYGLNFNPANYAVTSAKNTSTTAYDVTDTANLNQPISDETATSAQQGYDTQMNVINEYTPDSNGSSSSSSGDDQQLIPMNEFIANSLTQNGSYTVTPLEKGVQVHQSDDSDYWAALGYDS